jgi:hypothetical protein
MDNRSWLSINTNSVTWGKKMPTQLRPVLALIGGLVVFGSIPSFCQTIEFDDGTVGVAKFHDFTSSNGLLQVSPEAADANADASAGLAFFRTQFLSLGTKLIPMTILGSDPGQGTGTTVIPTVIVPLRFVFPNPGNPVLDGTARVTEVQNSPIFQNADYSAGGISLGVTQYGDALQRAQFWNYPGFSESDYHVLLAPPVVAPTVTAVVPATGCGATRTASCGTAALTVSGALVGRLDSSFFSSLINPLVRNYAANVLVIFQTDNVVLYNGVPSNCCAIGFHNSDPAPIATAHTWIFHSYSEPNTFTGDAILDVQALSHEVAEWLNDPFVATLSVANLVAPFRVPGQGNACQVNFETGDVLETPPIVFTKSVMGTTYHLQDEAFLPYFLHGRSFSVNGWYTFLNSFPTASTLCGPG